MIPIAMHWQVSSEPLGIAADFCEYCHVIRAFSVMKQTQLTSIYVIPVAEHDLGYLKRCSRCSLYFKAQISDYLKLETEQTPIEMLIAATHPDVEKNHAMELKLNRKIELKAIPLEAIRLLIRDRITELTPLIARRKPKQSLGLYIAIFGGLFVGLLMRWITQNQDASFILGVLSAIIIAIGMVPLSYFEKRRDFMKFITVDVEPTIKEGIKFLNPTVDDLNYVLRILADEGHAIALQIRVENIL